MSVIHVGTEIRSEPDNDTHIKDALCKEATILLIPHSVCSGTEIQVLRASAKASRRPFDGSELIYSKGATTRWGGL